MITGTTLINWGFKPGPWFKEVLPLANQMLDEGADEEFLRLWISEQSPAEVATIPLRTNTLPFEIFLEPETIEESGNVGAVISHFDQLMRVPTIKAGAVMPDACPSGSQPGTIPVGGVVACENAIHPGFHSSDICCSMAITVLGRNVNPGRVLDTAMKITHFGPGGRTDNPEDLFQFSSIGAVIETNPFLQGLEQFALRHFMTQGDGNHFFFVGELESTGETAIVTHHGSRGFGAQLYKRGKACAERMTRRIAPEVPAHQAWIVADSQEGQDYWKALQTIRTWTGMNHFGIHRAVLKALDVKARAQFWNEHNFVFQRSDGLFYHAKGATPSYADFAFDDSGLTLIPMNMGRPILITTHTDEAKALGFAPHGAGRNLSRTRHMKLLAESYGDSRGLSPHAIEEVLAAETKGIDARFYCGKPDLSELPSAYKNPDQVEAGIVKHNLARIVDRVMPLGSIMAGDNQPWRKK